jgi:hypothetical protein
MKTESKIVEPWPNENAPTDKDTEGGRVDDTLRFCKVGCLSSPEFRRLNVSWLGIRRMRESWKARSKEINGTEGLKKV